MTIVSDTLMRRGRLTVRRGGCGAATWTFVTFAVAVPLPLVTAQVRPDWTAASERDAICAATRIGVLNVKAVARKRPHVVAAIVCSTKPNRKDRDRPADRVRGCRTQTGRS